MRCESEMQAVVSCAVHPPVHKECVMVDVTQPLQASL